jgi:hypothetical protein
VLWPMLQSQCVDVRVGCQVAEKLLYCVLAFSFSQFDMQLPILFRLNLGCYFLLLCYGLKSASSLCLQWI